MMADNKKTSRGFAGLDDMATEVNIHTLGDLNARNPNLDSSLRGTPPSRQPVGQSVSPQPQQTAPEPTGIEEPVVARNDVYSSPIPPKTNSSGWATGVGILVVMMLIGALFSVLNPKATTYPPQVAAPSEPVPPLVPTAQTEPGAPDAVQELFGVNAPAGFVKTPVYELSLFVKIAFKLNGEDHLAILLKTRKIDPTTNKPWECHVCSADISAVVYQHVGNGWQLVSKSKEFAELGAWGDATNTTPIQIIYDLAPDTTAFLFDAGASGQGYTNSGKAMIAMVGTRWIPLGFIDTHGDNAGDCQNAPPAKPEDDFKPCWKYEGKISVKDATSLGFRDILVERTGTKSGSSREPMPATDVTYRYTQKNFYEHNEE